MVIFTDTWLHVWDNESPLGVSGCLLSQLHPPPPPSPPECACKLPFFLDIVLIFGFFNSPTFSSNNIWSLTWEKSQKQHQGNGETWAGARLEWGGAGKTVGQRATRKDEGKRVRERRLMWERGKKDGRMDREREWGGWREEGFNPAWIMEQTGAGEEEEREIGSPSIRSSMRSRLCLLPGPLGVWALQRRAWGSRPAPGLSTPEERSSARMIESITTYSPRWKEGMEERSE